MCLLLNNYNYNDYNDDKSNSEFNFISKFLRNFRLTTEGMPGRIQSSIYRWTSTEGCPGVKKFKTLVHNELSVHTTQAICQQSKSVETNPTSCFQSPNHKPTDPPSP